MRIPNRLMPHGGLASFKADVGHTGKGRALDKEVVPERACIQERRRLVKGSATETVSTATVWFDPEYRVPVGSEVTIWIGRDNQRTTEALEVQYLEHGPGLPAHVEVLCR